MNLHRLLALAFTTLALTSATAGAEDTHNTPAVYTFGDDLVRGQQKSGSGEILVVRTRDERESLVKARTHWLPELFRSVEDL